MDAAAILALARSLGRLKLTRRTGWVVRGIAAAESVADHAYRTTHLVMLLADAIATAGRSIDTAKAIRMAQLHEIGEALIGDIPQNSPIAPETKHAIEAQAVAHLTAPLGRTGELYRRLWEEFEEGVSAEARLVRAADRLEMLIQAREYEQVGYRSLLEFWRSPRPHFSEFPLVEAIASLLDREHADGAGSGGGGPGAGRDEG